MHSEFVHLHLHTEYSLLDGAIRLKSLFENAKKFEMPALAITDHGNMFGAIEFYEIAMEYDIKPILGCELYVTRKSRLEKDSQDSLFHLIVLVKDIDGYKNLNKLVTKGYLEGFYYHPRVDIETLKEYNKGLIALSSCLKGEVPYLISKGEVKRAINSAIEYKEIFNDGRFYLELQRNNSPDQDKINEEIVSISRKLNIPLVATNDCHYIDKRDARIHDILLCIQTGKTVNDPKRMKFPSEEFYFKSPDEMASLFSDVPESINNSLEIAEKCNLKLELEKLHFPKFPLPDNEDINAYLEKLAFSGLSERLNNEIDKEKYFNRLKYELNVIKDMGFAGYFLIVSDFINYAKNNNIPVGPGRGSAAGSLVAYSLNITDIDPIKYNLLFERFLNPERISMPDIDIDFCMDKREDVIRYVTNKYGNENVAQIITFGKMQAKGVVRDVGRVLNIPYGEVDKIAKLIPNYSNIGLEEAISLEPRLEELIKTNKKIEDLMNIAKALEGMVRHASTHAAGIVISNRPLTEYLPLYKGQKGEVVTQYSMNSIGDIGLIKFDLLGLKTLTVINKAVEFINNREYFNIHKIPLDDKDTFELLSSGKTGGVFQLEGTGIKDLLVKLKPESFEDIVATVALYRPGPLGSGMVDEFIKRKHGKLPIKYEIPQLREILKETYGVILYQEQVMRIASELANFSLGEADVLRKAMGKKNMKEMEGLKERFLEGAKRNGIKKNKAERLFDLMANFAEYGFNKSHSVSYALVSYQTAYLKAHYPLEFMSALLTSEMGNSDKIVKYINECRDMGIEVLPPDINESNKDFSVISGKIRFGLAAVKNVGDGAIEAIISAREKKGKFKSIYDFCERVDLRRVNRKVVESLIKCGAFDFTGMNRSQLMAILEDAIRRGKQEKSRRQIDMFSNFNDIEEFPYIKEWDESQLLAFEKETLGFYITGHPLKRYESDILRYTDSDSVNILNKKDGDEVIIGGVVSSIKETITKKGNKMAFITLEDLKGSIEVIIFSDAFKNFSHILYGDKPIIIKGKIDMDEDKVSLIAREIMSLEEVIKKNPSDVHIKLNVSDLSITKLYELRTLLNSYKGNSNTFIHLLFVDGNEIIMSLPTSWRVNPSNTFIEESKKIFGYNIVTLC